MTESYKMQVSLNNPEDPNNYLSVRKGPGTQYDAIGRLGHGAIVTVQSKNGDWVFATYGDSGSGYVNSHYLKEYIETENTTIKNDVFIVDSVGNRFAPIGDFKVYFGSVD